MHIQEIASKLHDMLDGNKQMSLQFLKNRVEQYCDSWKIYMCKRIKKEKPSAIH